MKNSQGYLVLSAISWLVGFRQKSIGENKSGEILLQYYTTRLYTVHCHVTITHFHLTVTILTAANFAVLQEKLADFAHQCYTIGLQLPFNPGVLKKVQKSVNGDAQDGLEELLITQLE